MPFPPNARTDWTEPYAFDWTTLAPPLRSNRGPTWKHVHGTRHRRPRTRWGRPDPLDPYLTPARPWAPLTDAEWWAIEPILRACGVNLPSPPDDVFRPDDERSPREQARLARAGRRMTEPRRRLDAIFRLCTMKVDTPKGKVRAPWRLLAEAPGGDPGADNAIKPDTASRTHRRWAVAYFWRVLLARAFQPDAPPALAGLLHWICCAYRRAIRVMGLDAVVLARRLGLTSALTAPEHWLPNPDLSEAFRQLKAHLRRAWEKHVKWLPPPGIRGKDDLHLIEDRINGRKRIPRWAEPA